MTFLVTPTNLGSEFDIGVIEASKIHIKTDNTTIKRDPSGVLSSVGQVFDFNKLTGVASVTSPTGAVTSWACNPVVVEDDLIGWAWPTAALADLPAPDVTITDLAGTVEGKAYSHPIPVYFTVPVYDLAGSIKYYGASVKASGVTYVTVIDTSATPVTHYILAP